MNDLERTIEKQELIDALDDLVITVNIMLTIREDEEYNIVHPLGIIDYEMHIYDAYSVAKTLGLYYEIIDDWSEDIPYYVQFKYKGVTFFSLYFENPEFVKKN